MKCKNLNEGKNLFNEIKKLNEMEELSEGFFLKNEIKKFNEMQELKEGKEP